MWKTRKRPRESASTVERDEKPGSVSSPARMCLRKGQEELADVRVCDSGKARTGLGSVVLFLDYLQKKNSPRLLNLNPSNNTVWTLTWTPPKTASAMMFLILLVCFAFSWKSTEMRSKDIVPGPFTYLLTRVCVRTAVWWSSPFWQSSSVTWLPGGMNCKRTDIFP